jgi:hypothetical protein
LRPGSRTQLHVYGVPDSQPNERGILSARKGQPFATVKVKKTQKKKKVTKGPGIFEENRDIQFVYTLGV